MEVPGEAVEFCDDERCLRFFRGGHGGGELGALRVPAALHFGEFFE
jgi:hypothetical protein